MLLPVELVVQGDAKLIALLGGGESQRKAGKRGAAADEVQKCITMVLV